MSAPAAQPGSRGQRLAIAASVVVVATVVGALVAMGSPAQQRMRALDARRVQALTSISQAIELHAEQKEALPAALTDLAGAHQWLPLRDPDTGAPYAYAKTGDRTYRLCATFQSSTQVADVRSGWSAEEWAHPVGRHCFDRKWKQRNGSD